MKRSLALAAALTAMIIAARIYAQAPAANDQPAPKPTKETELARPNTLQYYIDRYSGDLGCTIGGQTFRNFRLRTQHSVDEAKLEGRPHPQPLMTPDKILVTPVNYVVDGRRWVGFRWTTGPDGWTILGGDKNPPDYPYKKGHDIKNAGFTSNYDIRMEVHGTTPWQRAKIAYAGLATDCLVDGKWSEAANIGPGSRGNFGFHVGKIGQYGHIGAINPKTPQSSSQTRMSSISRVFSGEAKAPSANENWLLFPVERAPISFETRAGTWADYNGHEPHLYSYGMWFRMNCWGRTNTRWHADYIEWAFSNESLTDEIWTSDGKNKAAPPAPLPQPKEPLPKEPLPVAKLSGKKMTLDCGNDVQLTLVEIPAGKFIMGSPDNEKLRGDNEGPQRVVTISRPFYIGMTEVTQAQYTAVRGGPGSMFKSPDRPVDNVRRTSAMEFCKVLSQKTGKIVRLPTEAEWEYAARAGSTTAYSFGEDPAPLKEYGRALGSGGDRGTQPVGQGKPNAWGLFDMHGNVWEWTADMYTKNYVDAPAVDPKNPEGETPTLRGGSWSYPPEYSRSATRLLGSPNDTADGGTTGLRIVVEEPPQNP